MRFPLFRRKHASGAYARDRLGTLRKALDRAGVDYSPANPQGALANLAPSPAPICLNHVFPQRFESPLPYPGKIAFFTGLFRPDNSGKLYPDLALYEPDLLVLPLNDALELTRGSAGSASAIVVITSIADAPLAEHHLDLMWRSLGLPVFEQITAWDGTVIARECEIHNGLHVVGEHAIAEVAGGELLLTQLTANEPTLSGKNRVHGADC